MAGIKGSRVEQGPSPNSKRTGAASAGPGRPKNVMPAEDYSGVKATSSENAATFNTTGAAIKTRETSGYGAPTGAPTKAARPGKPRGRK